MLIKIPQFEKHQDKARKLAKFYLCPYQDSNHGPFDPPVLPTEPHTLPCNYDDVLIFVRSHVWQKPVNDTSK